MSVTENIIRIRNVTKVFQMGSESIHAVDNVSLNIHKEEVCCLFGKSGSGKSTLLNLIAGLEKPTEGRILFHNKHIERMNEDQLVCVSVLSFTADIDSTGKCDFASDFQGCFRKGAK